uniref:Uncharacterized protein n=1 Tax=Sphaerodactylus townsendi TaxID=933632 RepID=A0ACB8FBP3_9SAUR
MERAKHPQSSRGSSRQALQDCWWLMEVERAPFTAAFPLLLFKPPGHMWCLFELWARPLELPAPQAASARPQGGLLGLHVCPSKARHAQQPSNNRQPAAVAAAPHMTWQEPARGGPPRMSPLALCQ